MVADEKRRLWQVNAKKLMERQKRGAAQSNDDDDDGDDDEDIRDEDEDLAVLQGIADAPQRSSYTTKLSSAGRSADATDESIA